MIAASLLNLGAVSSALPGVIMASGQGPLVALSRLAFEPGSSWLTEPAIDNVGAVALFRDPRQLARAAVANDDPSTGSPISLLEGVNLVVAGAVVLATGTGLWAIVRALRNWKPFQPGPPQQEPESAQEILDRFLTELQGRRAGETIRTPLDSKQQGLEILRLLNQDQRYRSQWQWQEIVLGERKLPQIHNTLYYLMANKDQPIAPQRKWAFIARSRRVTKLSAEIFPSPLDLSEVAARDWLEQIGKGTRTITPFGTATAVIENNVFVLEFEANQDVPIDMIRLIAQLKASYANSGLSMDIYYADLEHLRVKLYTNPTHFA